METNNLALEEGSKKTVIETPQSRLPTLPQELLYKIFVHLEPASAVCLCLTCKRLYIIHFALYGLVMNMYAISRKPNGHFNWLFQLLDGWMGPRYEYCDSREKFVRQDAYNI